MALVAYRHGLRARLGHVFRPSGVDQSIAASRNVKPPRWAPATLPPRWTGRGVLARETGGQRKYLGRKIPKWPPPSFRTVGRGRGDKLKTAETLHQLAKSETFASGH